MKGFALIPLICLSCFASAVHAAPIIASQPQPVSVNNGSAAEFSFAASGVVSNQWLFNNIPIPIATNAVLSLDNVSQSGPVSAILYASDGSSVTTQPASLTLIPGTIIQLTISGFSGGASSNLTIQLFDHDKPASVENFLHYVTSGAYSNMFFDRLVPDFVLQGGSYKTTNEFSDATFSPLPVLTGGNPLTGFPASVANEYTNVTIISNRFGTLAMAKQPGNPDSAENAFFFNLADNSTNLDNQNGGFTVFGRVIAGTNLLGYFNTFSTNGGGIFDESIYDPNSSFSALPVNNSGRAFPVNSNLFYASFAPVTNADGQAGAYPPPDTTPPTVTFSSVSIDTNTSDVVIYGTAADNIGVANIQPEVLGFQTGIFENPIAQGANVWSADAGELPPGNYTLQINSQDGEGNYSTNAGTGYLSTNFTVPAVNFVVKIQGNGAIKPSSFTNASSPGYGEVISLKETPGKGTIFAGWFLNTNQGSYKPTFLFTNINGGVVTARFISNNLPGGIYFTSPASAAQLTNPVVTFSGGLRKNVTLPARITFAVYHSGSQYSASPTYTLAAPTNTWSLTLPELAPGNYVARAIVVDANGKSTVVNQSFSVLSAVDVIANGPGTTTLPPGLNYLPINQINRISAVASNGQSFAYWYRPDVGGQSNQASIAFALTPDFTANNPLTLQANFVANSLPATNFSLTSPKAGSTIYTNSFTVTGTAASSVTIITCQCFQYTVPVTPVVFATISNGVWTANIQNTTGGSQSLVVTAYDNQGNTRYLKQTVVLNLFPIFAGSYSGIFSETGGGDTLTPTTAGMINVKVTSSGAASGRLVFPGSPIVFPISTRFNAAGFTVFNPGTLDGETLFTELLLPLDTPDSESLSGVVAQQIASSYITAYKNAAVLTTNSNPSPGNYVLLLAPVSPTIGEPTGDGFALLNISTNGAATIPLGVLPDACPFTESTGVSAQGDWPLFAVPPAYVSGGVGRGMIMNGYGSLNFIYDTNKVSGFAYWVKNKLPGKKPFGYYTAGFPSALSVNVNGAIYQAPTNGNYDFVFSGSSFTNTVTNTLTFASGQFETNGDVLNVNLATNGLLTGQILNTQSHVTNGFQGAFVNPTFGGGGFVTNQPNNSTAAFSVAPSP